MESYDRQLPEGERHIYKKKTSYFIIIQRQVDDQSLPTDLSSGLALTGSQSLIWPISNRPIKEEVKAEEYNSLSFVIIKQMRGQ